jgi:two-component system, cell cycle response regulator
MEHAPSMNPNADQIIERAPRIPSLPSVALKVLEMTRAANTDVREMAALIENDQGLAAKVIRTVNSSFYGLSKPCGTINQALVYLGLDAARTLVLGFSLVDCIDGGGDHDVSFDYVDYWRRAIHSAVAARELAALARTCNPDEAFLAALLQDIGMVALNRAFADRYLQAIDMVGGCHHKLVEIERQSLEVDHAEMGAALAARWNLPPQHVEAIRCHHSADDAADLHKIIAGIVELAGCAAETAAVPGAEPRPEAAAAVARFRALAKTRLGIAPEQADAVITVMARRAVELAWMLRVEAGRGLDVERILAQAEDLRTEHVLSVIRDRERIERDGHEAAGPASPGELTSSKQFELALADCYQAALADGKPLALLLGEVDRLATITNALSRPDAESLLRKVESRLTACMSGDGRLLPCDRMLSGFAVVVPGMDRMGAAKEAETLRRAIEAQPIVIDSTGVEQSPPLQLGVTMSFGAAAIDGETRPPGAASIGSAAAPHRLAEHALQAARAAGRNSVRVYNPAAAKERAA